MMDGYEKCLIYRSTEWVVWDPNKKMLHLFDDGQGALEFFNEGMPVTHGDARYVEEMVEEDA